MASQENPRISSAKLALAVRRLREDKANLELVASDPIAIIGMGCRFSRRGQFSREFLGRSERGARRRR